LTLADTQRQLHLAPCSHGSHYLTSSLRCRSQIPDFSDSSLLIVLDALIRQRNFNPRSLLAFHNIQPRHDTLRQFHPHLKWLAVLSAVFSQGWIAGDNFINCEDRAVHLPKGIGKLLFVAHKAP
jgi:hypothetical protein